MKKALISMVLSVMTVFCMCSSAFAQTGTYNSTYSFTHLLDTQQRWVTDGTPTFTITTTPNSSNSSKDHMIYQLMQEKWYNSESKGSSVTVNAKSTGSATLTGSGAGTYYIRFEAIPWSWGDTELYSGSVNISYSW